MTDLLNSVVSSGVERSTTPDPHSGTIDCLVLCGGLGTRLADVLGERPKALAEVSGRPFIEWVLLQLRGQGITDVLLATGHGGDQVEAHLADGGHLGLRLRYSREPAPLGTAGAVRLALRQLRGPRLLVVNGDTYGDVDVAALRAAHAGAGAAVTMLASRVTNRSRYGALEVDGRSCVTTFGEKTASGPGLVSSGVYLLDRRVVETLPEHTRLDLEADVFGRLAPGALHAVVSEGGFIDMGTPDSYEHAAAVIDRMARPALAGSPAEAARHTRRHLEETIATLRAFADEGADAVAAAGLLIASAFTAGGKLLLCGNGGSAADCQHMAAEFVSRLDRHFDRAALPAIALTTDSSFLTAYTNDVDFDGVFARQVEALGRPGDVLLAISTSGASVNVRRAIEAARRRHLDVVGLFGSGAPLATEVDVAVTVPSANPQAAQECMLAAEHSICEIVERVLYGAPEPRS